MKRLSELLAGERGIIEDIEKGAKLRARLYDLGFVPGTEILCAIKSPFGDPTAYFVRGTLIALRCEDSQSIILK